MEYVVPIKDIKKINIIKEVLRKSSQRDLILFVLGINTGIRLHDLLFLKVGDVWDGTNVKEFLYLQDEKSGEVKGYYLNKSVKRELKKYLSTIEADQDDYLFKSKKDQLPISRQQAYRIINHAAKEAGITERIGTHTLRKTFGYHAYRKGVAISILMSIFNHHSRSETLKYIGIEKEEQQMVKVDVNL